MEFDTMIPLFTGIATEATMSAKPTTRVRGLAAWNPSGKTSALLTQIDAILSEYRDHLPLTIRQIFYRLVASCGYPKDAHGYERLTELLNRARRSGRVSFAVIRDDGGTQIDHDGYSGKTHFLRALRYSAQTFARDRLEGQPCRVELWCEAAGMVPQLARVAEPYGISVYSSGGFESVTEKHGAAERFVDEERSTVVLHVGDHDPSGVALFAALNEDVTQMCADLGAPGCVAFVRVVVTPAQIEKYGLPEAPAKVTDRRGHWEGGTVQAEALAPDQLADEVGRAIEAQIDRGALARIRAIEAAERGELLALMDRALAAEGGGR